MLASRPRKRGINVFTYSDTGVHIVSGTSVQGSWVQVLSATCRLLNLHITTSNLGQDTHHNYIWHATNANYNCQNI